MERKDEKRAVGQLSWNAYTFTHQFVCNIYESQHTC